MSGAVRKKSVIVAGGYAPVPFNPAAEAARLQRESPAFAQAWTEQEDEFAALDVLLCARQRAGLAQAKAAPLAS